MQPPRIDGPISPAVRTDIGPGKRPRSPSPSPEHRRRKPQHGKPCRRTCRPGAEAIATAAAGPVHSAPTATESTPLPEAGVPAPRLRTTHASAAGADFTKSPQHQRKFTPPLAAAQLQRSRRRSRHRHSMPPRDDGSTRTAKRSDGLRRGSAPTRCHAGRHHADKRRRPVRCQRHSTPPAGSAPTGQPAVVRQQPLTPPGAHPRGCGLTESAVAATASGAAASAAAAERRRPKPGWAATAPSGRAPAQPNSPGPSVISTTAARYSSRMSPAGGFRRTSRFPPG